MVSTLHPAYGVSPEHAKAIKTAGNEEKNLKEACRGFEAIFIHKIMQSMRATETDGGLIKKSNAEKIFTDLLDEEFSREAASQSVNGIADMMFEQLKTTLLSAENYLDGRPLHRSPGQGQRMTVIKDSGDITKTSHASTQ